MLGLECSNDVLLFERELFFLVLVGESCSRKKFSFPNIAQRFRGKVFFFSLAKSKWIDRFSMVDSWSGGKLDFPHCSRIIRKRYSSISVFWLEVLPG